MTKHVDYTHTCPECGALYIPYDNDVPCPQCGLVEDERFDFIPAAVASALFNLESGRYVPAAWYVGSYADHLLRLVFIMLEQYRTSDKSVSFEVMARGMADRMAWHDQEYGKDHVVAIACRVHEEIQKESGVRRQETGEGSQ